MSKITRRDFLRISGATFVALLGGTVWRATDQGVFPPVMASLMNLGLTGKMN